MRKTLIRGRKFCKKNQIQNIHIEYLLPTRFVNVKKQMMRYARQMKINQKIYSYDVIMREAEPVLRTFYQSDGVMYRTLGDLQPTGDTEMIEDDQMFTDEDGNMLIAIFDPERDLP